MKGKKAGYTTFTISHNIATKVHNSAGGHMTHINPSEHAQTTGSSHWACSVCQTLEFPVPNL